VMGRADRFVQAEPQLQPLVTRLLSHTWIVEHLDVALRWARDAAEFNYVTLAGELLQTDGILTVGPRHETTGLISRRSQLRALTEQLAQLQAEREQCEADSERLQTQQTQAEADLVRAREARQEAADALAAHRFRISSLQQQQEQLGEQFAALQAESQTAESEHDAASTRLAEVVDKRTQLESNLADMEAQLAGLDEQVSHIESRRLHQEREATQRKVELAKSEERLRNLHTRRRQFEEHYQERRRAISDSHERLTQSLKRADSARWAILHAESEVAELYLQKESFHSETTLQINER